MINRDWNEGITTISRRSTFKKTSNLQKFEKQVPEIRCEGNDCELDRIIN